MTFHETQIMTLILRLLIVSITGKNRKLLVTLDLHTLAKRRIRDNEDCISASKRSSGNSWSGIFSQHRGDVWLVWLWNLVMNILLMKMKSAAATTDENLKDWKACKCAIFLPTRDIVIMQLIFFYVLVSQVLFCKMTYRRVATLIVLYLHDPSALLQRGLS